MTEQDILNLKRLNRRIGFLPTPAEYTQGLIANINFKGGIWEPACGDGDISRVLIEAGYRVMSSDRYEYDWAGGEWRVDFLGTRRTVDNVVSNPPWRDMAGWVAQAKRCATKRIALMYPIAFLVGLDGKDRSHIFDELRWLLIFKRTPQFVQGGFSPYPMGWYVWQRGWTKPPVIRWI